MNMFPTIYSKSWNKLREYNVNDEFFTCTRYMISHEARNHERNTMSHERQGLIIVTIHANIKTIEVQKSKVSLFITNRKS